MNEYEHEHDSDSGDTDDIEAAQYFANAVDSFDIDSIFIDEECYKKQIDIYSDQLVAIEALRRLI